MKIADSAIAFSSQHSYEEIYRKSESLTLWDNRQDSGPISQGTGNPGVVGQRGKSGQQASLVELSVKALGSRRIKAAVMPVEEDKKALADLNLRILAAMIERLTGKKIDITLPEESAIPAGEMPVVQEAPSSDPRQAQNGLQGFGLIYEYSESYQEFENTSFSAQGLIHTADGQAIDISVQLSMSREFISEKNISIRAGDALKDPLMLNFSGSAAEISQRNFDFDIDSDGQLDQIAFAGPQGGFLAYDKNGDGIINNGSELFGPESGNGFDELAAYDSDGNNWIDENDDIYSRLRIWMKTAEGQEQLFALGEKGVGAIYLNHISTPFSVKDANNQLVGQVRTSGIFLGENGGVGSIQQIDLAA